MRAVLVVALLVPLTGAADGMEPPAVPVEGTEYWALGGKSVDQVHSPILVFNQPSRFKAPAQARNEDSKKKSSGAPISAQLGESSGRGSGASSPQRGTTRQTQPVDQNAPTYGGLSGARVATMDEGSRSTNPCSRDGYHDNVMSHGLDTARTKCELHQLDKNRWQLLALSGGDPLLHNAMEKPLDKGLDLFGVPK